MVGSSGGETSRKVVVEVGGRVSGCACSSITAWEHGGMAGWEGEGGLQVNNKVKVGVMVVAVWEGGNWLPGCLGQLAKAKNHPNLSIQTVLSQNPKSPVPKRTKNKI